MAKTLTNEELFTIIDEEAKNLGMLVIVEENLPLGFYFQTLGMASQVVGTVIPNEAEDRVYIFLESLQKVMRCSNQILEKLGPAKMMFDFHRDPQGSMRKYIRGILKHEYRHMQQFNYMRSHGIDAKEFCEKENSKPWYKRLTRLDAWLYENFSIGLPLSIVCS